MSIQTKTMTVKSDTSLAETTTTIRDTVTFDVSKMPNGITYKGLKAVLSFAEPIQWNKASTYDALTVVWDDASHGSYASKRPVPANIELTNEFYWLRTADLDAQVEMYRQEVMEFDGRITANTQAIASETTRAENAEQTLQGNIDFLSEKKVLLLFGDSFTAEGWGEGDKWWTYVRDYFNYEICNYAVGGYTFGNEFNSEVNNAKTNMTDSQKKRIDKIIVYGGVNNVAALKQTPSQFLKAINSTLDKITYEFPNIPIYLAITNQGKYMDDTARVMYYLFEDNIFSKPVTVLNTTYINTLRNNFVDDNLHLNSKGNLDTGLWFINALNGNITFSSMYGRMGSTTLPYTANCELDGLVYFTATASKIIFNFTLKTTSATEIPEFCFPDYLFFVNTNLFPSFVDTNGNRHNVTPQTKELTDSANNSYKRTVYKFDRAFPNETKLTFDFGIGNILGL